MKTLYIILFAASILSGTAAQAQQGFHLGGQWGPHLSWLMNQDDKNNADFEYVTTWRGAFAINSQYGFTPATGIGLSGLYSFQGQHYKLKEVEYFKRVEYIKVPLMFIYNHPLSQKLMMIYKIGPQVGFLTHARVTDENGNNILSDQRSSYENLTFGAVASAGIGIPLIGNLFLDLTLRYDYDFTNAENEDHNLSINDPLVSGNGNGNGNGSPSGRAITNNMTAGINIGIRYLFGCGCQE